MKRWMVGLLIVSLAFNLAFVGGMIYRRWTRQLPPPPVRAMEPQRREALRQRMEEMRENGRGLVDEFQRARNEFVETMRDSSFDQELALQRLEISIEHHMRMERDIGRNFIELRKEMTPEEAARFFEHMKKKQARFGGPHEPHHDDNRRPDPRPAHRPRGPRMERP